MSPSIIWCHECINLFKIDSLIVKRLIRTSISFQNLSPWVLLKSQEPLHSWCKYVKRSDEPSYISRLVPSLISSLPTVIVELVFRSSSRKIRFCSPFYPNLTQDHRGRVSGYSQRYIYLWDDVSQVVYHYVLTLEIHMWSAIVEWSKIIVNVLDQSQGIVGRNRVDELS